MSHRSLIVVLKYFAILWAGIAAGYLLFPRTAALPKVSEGSEPSQNVNEILSQKFDRVDLKSLEPEELDTFLQSHTALGYVITRDMTDHPAPVTPLHLRDTTLGDLLRLISLLRPGFGATAAGNTYRFSYNSADRSPGVITTMSYYVGDLLDHADAWCGLPPLEIKPPLRREEARDALHRLVINLISPDSWRDAGGGIGSVELPVNELIVTQTADVQTQIADLLEVLRRIVDDPHRGDAR